MNTVSAISDQDLRSEFIRRFSLKRGEMIDSSETAARHFQTLLVNNAKQEQFLVIYLTSRNEVISCETLFNGGLTSSSIYPRILISKALEVNAAALVLGHNHPSGNLKPSADDVNITQRLVKAVRLVDMTIHDHIIIGYGRQGYYSFADNGKL